LVCGFQHNSHPFSDCFLCFTHVMGTLVQFTLLLCYICFYMFLGGVGTNSLPSFHRGKNRAWWWSQFKGPVTQLLILHGANVDGPNDVERQARPDPPASRRMEKHTKNINARDPQDSRRQEESGLTFGRAEHFTFHFLLDFTGAYPLFDHPRLHRAPLLGSTTPTSDCTARTFNIRLASKSNPFDSNPLLFLSSLSFLVT